MTLTLRTLPILEQWDCHHCTACCRETTIPLSADDRARLRGQKWEEQPEYRGVRTVRRASLGGEFVLAHREDGSCVFLTEAGRCRIHEKFGAEAKPRVCQLFPLQAVATDRGACVTVRRSCPSAAADRGRPLEQHVPGLKRLLRDRFERLEAPVAAPPIVRGATRPWDDFHVVAEALGALVVDARWPLVRRVVHGLGFCTLLEEVQWPRVDSQKIGDLVAVLAESAPGASGAAFQDRRAPPKSIGRLFRRLGGHFIRCSPGGRPTRTLWERWGALGSSGRLARARGGRLPELHPRFPAVSLDQLERPVGPLAEDVLRPLNRFFETHALSKQFALADPRASLVESFRRLAFTHPMALWMLRWLAIDREPTPEDMVEIVVALERGYVMPALGTAANYMARGGEFERLVAWYGR